MEIFVRVVDDFGRIAWWNTSHTVSYLYDSKDLKTTDEDGYEIIAGTPFKTIQDAKKGVKDAIYNATFDGFLNPKVDFWQIKNGKLERIHFTEDNKIEAVPTKK